MRSPRSIVLGLIHPTIDGNKHCTNDADVFRAPFSLECVYIQHEHSI